MRLANLAYYSREFSFLNLKLKLFRQHTGSAGSFFTLKQYNKTPDLNIRVQADTAYRLALVDLKKADELYRKILSRLPAEKADTPYTAKLREHATERENRIKEVLA